MTQPAHDITVRHARFDEGHFVIRNLDDDIDRNDMGLCIVPLEHIDHLIEQLTRLKNSMELQK